MNRLYLLIPAVNDSDAGEDIAYLKLLGDIDASKVINIFKEIKKSLKYVKEDELEIVFDQNHLNGIIKSLKEKRQKGNASDEMPQLENLLQFLNDAYSIQDLKAGNNPVVINGMTVSQGLVNAFVDDQSHNTLLNKKALNDFQHPIEVELQGETHLYTPLLCDAADVYLWLVENRYPSRQLDSNYKKHSENSKLGKNGVAISPIKYEKKQLNDFLKKAVVAKKGLRELYFKDVKNDKIIVFWDENLITAFYHAFEISVDDIPEIQKIFKRGGRDLVTRIKETAELFKD